MLIKDRDAKEGVINQLNDLLHLSLSPRKKFLIERELNNLNPGVDGGKNASHFLNFYCAESPNWAVIHDLKIDYEGYTTRIDHLLINQYIDIYLFDSKNYTYNVKIKADGGFLVFDGRQYQSVESPLEENEKRIRALRNVLIDNKIVPKRMGFTYKPRIESFVLASPGSNILRPPVSIYDTSSVITVDFLIKKLLQQLKRIKRIYQKLRRLPNAIKTDTLAELAGKLASMNQSDPVNYQQLFGVDDIGDTPNMPGPKKDSTSYCDYAI
jgi:hypothetical protein